MRIKGFKIRTYTWNKGKPSAQPGLILHNHWLKQQMFIPLTAVTDLCDAMFDLYEKQQKEETK